MILISIIINFILNINLIYIVMSCDVIIIDGIFRWTILFSWILPRVASRTTSSSIKAISLWLLVAATWGVWVLWPTGNATLDHSTLSMCETQWDILLLPGKTSYFCKVDQRFVFNWPLFCRLSNVFIIGKGNKPWVSLPKGKGVKLSVAEERDRRLAMKTTH